MALRLTVLKYNDSCDRFQMAACPPYLLSDFIFKSNYCSHLNSWLKHFENAL